MTKNFIEAEFVDMSHVRNGDLSGLTEAERRCYLVGHANGVRLMLAPVLDRSWWQRVRWALWVGSKRRTMRELVDVTEPIVHLPESSS